MPAGHAYGKALRTVKTCVSSEWCRFGTQDSTQMGIDLEKLFFKMQAPHKVKLAVSGCPRNCAEVAIKDVGRRQRRHQDRGRAVPGQGEDARRGARIFRRLPATVSRRSALPRPHRALPRARRPRLREEKILDDNEGWHALYERLLFALSVERDPWVERAREGKLKHEFETVAA